jgi:hypothetical protein
MVTFDMILKALNILQGTKGIIDAICMVTVGLASRDVWRTEPRKDPLTGKVLIEEGALNEEERKWFVDRREELARAYTSIAKLGLGSKEELHY